MNILLVQHQGTFRYSIPLGLGYVAGSLLSHGHHVTYLDLSGCADPSAALASTVKKLKPQALGFTLWTNTYGEFVDLMRKISLPRGTRVVAGGPHASAEYETVLRDGCVDVAVLQEGELIAPGLFRALEENRGLESIRGIAFRGFDGSCVRTPDSDVPAELDHLPDIPYPIFEPLGNLDRIGGHPSAPLQTSRGCPYRCVFCYRGPAAGRKFRARSVERVIRDMENLHRAYGFKAFHFFDDIFSLDRERTLDLCTAMASLPWKPLWTCMTRVDRVDEQILREMYRAGCRTVSFGVESGNPDILARMGKGTTLEQAEQAVRLCRKIGLPSNAFFVMGTPWETPETFRQTVEFAKRLRPTNAIFFAATPYPGTRLREVFIERGIPLPEGYKGYAHFRPPWSRSAKDPNATDLSRMCAAAFREYTVHQLSNPGNYPRLFKENWSRYGARGMVRRLAQAAGVLRRS